jgi:hypothetical protein
MLGFDAFVGFGFLCAYAVLKDTYKSSKAITLLKISLLIEALVPCNAPQ